MRTFATALGVVTTALMVAPVMLYAQENHTAPTTWWRTVILPEKNPRCVVVEEDLYCPSGIPEVIATYEPVTDNETLQKIRDASEFSSLEADRE